MRRAQIFAVETAASGEADVAALAALVEHRSKLSDKFEEFSIGQNSNAVQNVKECVSIVDVASCTIRLTDCTYHEPGYRLLAQSVLLMSLTHFCRERSEWPIGRSAHRSLRRAAGALRWLRRSPTRSAHRGASGD